MPARDIVITLRAETDLKRVGEPVTCGVPFPRGLLHDATTLRMIAPDDSTTPLQVRVLDRWPDQSARWVLCDWQATGSGTITYRLRLDATEPGRVGEGFAEPTIAEPPMVGSAEPTPTLPGMASSSEPQTENMVRELATSLGHRLFSSESLHLVSGGRRYTALPDFDWFVEDAGPLRASILERGSLSSDGVNIARYTLRTHYFANSSVVRVHLTITNPNRSSHPGGLWDLGDSGSIRIDESTVTLPFASTGAGGGRISLQRGNPFEEFSGPLESFQVSSGGENWQSHNHLSASRNNWVALQGCRGLETGLELGVLRSTPIITLLHGEGQLSLTIPHFWQNFPKRLSAGLNGIELALFPRQLLAGHELQGGEQKEHVFYVAFGSDTITTDPLEWTRDPLIPVVDPEWIASTGAIPYFTSQAGDPHRDYQQLANAAIEGDDTFEKKREVIDEYGWRHFGDIYGDHEAILHTEHGPKPRVSHYNNQYDAIGGFAVHWLRSGDPRWFRQMNELASHVRDIDIYNTDEDKAAYNHGLFWHTYHYVDADTGTHRSYPKNGRIPPHNKPVPVSAST